MDDYLLSQHFIELSDEESSKVCGGKDELPPEISSKRKEFFLKNSSLRYGGKVNLEPGACYMDDSHLYGLKCPYA